MRIRSALWLTTALTALIVAGACHSKRRPKGDTQNFNVKVNAKSNIFRAGTVDLDTNGGGEVPAAVSFEPGADLVLTIVNVNGRVSCCGGGDQFNDADGGEFAGGVTDVESLGGISGITHPDKTMFLVGVFTDKSAAKPPGPERLRAKDPKNQTPELFQSFFIGANNGRQIKVPSNATRLVLGFADAYNFTGAPGSYDDNVGELTVTFSIKPR
jgi:hypothetical protein